MWTGSVRRVQSKCWSDTGERLEPIVVYRCCGTDKQKDLYKSLWNSKLVALKRESLLNTFADGGLNVVDIRTKIESLSVKQVLQLIKEHRAKWTFLLCP